MKRYLNAILLTKKTDSFKISILQLRNSFT